MVPAIGFACPLLVAFVVSCIFNDEQPGVAGMAGDLTPPVITYDLNYDSMVTDKDTVVLSGTAVDSSGISAVLVGGDTSTLAYPNWSNRTSLQVGLNAIVIRAIDASDNRNEFLDTLQITMSLPANQITWIKTFRKLDQSTGRAIKETGDGGYLLTGSSSMSDGENRDRLLLLKVDSTGNLVWDTLFAGKGSAHGISIDHTLDGGHIVLGQTYYMGDSTAVYLIRLNAEDQVQWAKIVDVPLYMFLREIRQTRDGGFVLVGSTRGGGKCTNQSEEAVLGKTDGLGTVLWWKTYGKCRGDVSGFAARETENGFMIAASNNEIDLDKYDEIWIVNTDKNGDTIRTGSYGDSLSDWPYSLEIHPEGGCVVAGQMDVQKDAREVFFIMRVDSLGRQVWLEKYGEEMMPSPGRKMTATKDGGYAMVGYCGSIDGISNSCVVVKTDSRGKMVWKRKHGETGSSETGSCIQETSDGGLIAVGNSIPPTGSGSVYVVKMNSEGMVE